MYRSAAVWLVLAVLAYTSADPHDPHFFVTRSKSVKGNDMQCNKQDSHGQPANFCRECGGVAALATKCSKMPQCKGFDMEDFRCGYFKTLATPKVLQDQVNFASFCKAAAGSDCTGDYEMCIGFDAYETGDYNCNYKANGIVQNYCRRNGDHIALMDECDRSEDCDGFSISIQSDNFGFGLLKKLPDKKNVWRNLKERANYIFFVKVRD